MDIYLKQQFGDGRLLSDFSDGTPIAVASRNSIKCGNAQIRCDIGNGAENFEAKIIRILPASEGTKGMVVEITDSRLLDATGGLCRGCRVRR